MPKRSYILALLCYLAIPVVMVAGGAAARVIGPEFLKAGLIMGGAALSFVLWIACCYFVLEARGRTRGWLAFALAGPLGFSVIAALKDRAPAPNDIYQAVIGRLNVFVRVGFEIIFFFAAWSLAYHAIVIKRDLAIRLQSAMTGRSVEDIVAEQLASSGMWAAGEFMESLYVVPLVYLLWPIVFNVVGRLFRPRAGQLREADAPPEARG